MDLETTDKAIQLLYRALPYSNQIKNLDTTKRGYISFDWRSDSFFLTISTGHLVQIIDNMQHGSNLSILMEELLKNQYVADFMKF